MSATAIGTDPASAYAPLIHAALVDRACATQFHQVLYPQGGTRMELGPPVACAKARTRRADGASWRESTNRLSGTLRERADWPWTLRLEFPVEVSLEAFEESMAADPPVIRRSVAEGRPFQVTLHIESLALQTPVEQSPASGMVAVYRVLAVPTPR